MVLCRVVGGCSLGGIAGSPDWPGRYGVAVPPVGKPVGINGSGCCAVIGDIPICGMPNWGYPACGAPACGYPACGTTACG